MRTVHAHVRDGLFVLVHETAIVETFATFDDALKAGSQRFGPAAFAFLVVGPGRVHWV